MSKIKMRCSQCGKSFKSSSAKQLICPDCEEKARRERLAKAKTPQPAAGTPPPAPPRAAPAKPAPAAARPQQSKQHWLDQERDVQVGTPEPKETARPPRLEAPPRPPSGALANVPAAHSAPARPAQLAPVAQRPAPAPAPKRGEPTRAPEKAAPQKKAEGEKRARAASGPPIPRPKREPRPPTLPFAPSAEQVTAIEQRYLELAQPQEYDGLRSQIAKELDIPKTAVKRVVSSLRDRMHLPSWWELQAYRGSPEEIQRIRQAYVALLPLPPVGVHKQIAEALNLSPGMVYQAIKSIRTEMNLPQYNPPETHGLPAAAAQS